jgi:type II secretory pathway pseudopilin PulG
MQRILEKTSQHHNRGFTLVEMLVVAPLFVITIAVLIGFILGLVGDSVATNTRSQAIYDVQSAMTQIERDSFLGTQFMSSFVPHSPQGKDDAVGSFNSNAGDIIINQFGTTSDPTDPTRSVVYYANQPQACSGQYQANQPFFVKVIYFLKTESDGSKTLYRRMIVPLNNTGSNNGDTTCGTPWQRGSCSTQNLSDARCQSKDIRLLTNVSSFVTTYYNKSNPSQTLTDPTIADSLKVTITVNKSVAGKTVTQTASVASSRTNNVDPTPKPPTTPVISIYNASDNNCNNPVKASFQWTSTGVTQYSYTYQVNGGAWSTPATTTGTNITIATPYSYVPIALSVTATNDNGSSTAQYLYTTPIWTAPNLQNNWSNYGYTYASAGYTKTSAGIILLKGLVQRSGTPAAGEAIFTLPAGLRPMEANMFLAGGVGAADRLDIYANGNVAYITGGAAFESLEGIAFIPAGSPYTWTTLPLTNGWAPYVDGTGWGTPGYTKDSLGRVFIKGLIKNGGTADGAAFATMPVGYRPPDYLHIATTSNAVFDATGVENGGNITTKGNALNGYRSVMLNYIPIGSVTWNNIPLLLNGWQWYGGGVAYPQYARGADGVVKLKGLISAGATASGTVIGNLPPGYRPREVSLQSGDCNTIYCRFDIQPNGDIIARDNISATWSSLDTITFLAEQ